MKKTLALMMLLTLCVTLLPGCGILSLMQAESEAAPEVPNPTVTIAMKTGGVIELELYPSIAPNTVANFVTLAQSGFYDGLIFHRVIPGFMIQGGDPLGTGMGGPDYSIKGEFESNGFPNDLKHTRGVISMARTGDPDSAGSQFFIMHVDADYLDGKYAAFGKVTSGIDVIDQIANMQVDSLKKPLVPEPCTIDTVTVDTKGYEYKVVKIEETP